jgi:hypothetical protein
MVLFAASIGLAQSDQPVAKTERVTEPKEQSVSKIAPSDQTLIAPALQSLGNDGAVQTSRTGVEWYPPATPGGRRPGSECGTTYLCGQNPGGTMWQYSDATFVNPGYGSGRIVCEKFPPPNEPVLTEPIGAIRWEGTYINRESNGCRKDHLFQIKFYPDAGNKPNVLNPAAT